MMMPKHVVEVVCQAADELADGLEPLGLVQPLDGCPPLGLGLFAPGDVPGDASRPDDRAIRSHYRRYRYRYIEQRTVLADPLGLMVVDPLAAP